MSKCRAQEEAGRKEPVLEAKGHFSFVSADPLPLPSLALVRALFLGTKMLAGCFQDALF